MYVVVAVVVGLVVGLLLRGRLSGLRIDRLTLWPLLPLSVVLGIDPYTGGAVGSVLGVTSWSVLVVFAVINFRQLKSLAVVVVGIGLNLVPITADGGMPVSITALATARHWSVARAAGDHLTGRHHLERSTDHFTALADKLPVGTLHSVMSVGDVVTAVGLAMVIVELMVRPAKQHPAAASQPVTRGSRPVA